MTTEMFFATLTVIGLVILAGVIVYDHFHKKPKHDHSR